MAGVVIAAPELRGSIAEALRVVGTRETVVITVDGRPARLTPPGDGAELQADRSPC